MKVKVLYFASLRDNSQIAEETIDTQAATIGDLFAELNEKYSFAIDKEHLRAAQNENYVPFHSPLAESDTIVFIPPVAGG